MEEGDYLSGLYGGRYFTQHANAESEERPRFATMLLDRDGTEPRRRHAGLDAQRHGQRQHGQQSRQLAGIGDVRVLQIEALGLEIGEQGFDRPPLAIAGQRAMRLGRAGERQKLARRQTHHDESHER